MMAEGGPGHVFLAPSLLGDILPIQIRPGVEFFASKGQFIASTSGIIRKSNSQGVGKGLFSGEGLFVDRISGDGLIFLSSLGSIFPIDLAPQQEYIIDNGHLVAWEASATYQMQKVGGFMSSLKTGEGLVCRFTGPGRIYIQSRNPAAVGAWIASIAVGGR